MKIDLTSRSPLSTRSELLVVPLFSRTAKKPTKAKPFASFSSSSRKELEQFDDYFDGALSAAIVRENYQAKKGQTISVFAPDARTSNGVRHIRLIGIGSDGEQLSKWGPDEWRVFGAKAYKTASFHKYNEFAVSLCCLEKPASAEIAQLLVEGLRLAAYSFDQFKGTARKRAKRSAHSNEVSIHFKKSVRPKSSSLSAAQSISNAVSLARDMVNTPPSDMTPKHIVQQAKRLTTGSKSPVQVQVVTKATLKRLGANAFLAVGRGGGTDPYLIHLRYTPSVKRKNRQRVVLVGKGVTFDTGGLSMKSPKGMVDMKCDMAGAAAVIGVMQAIRSLPASLRPAHEIHALIAASENMVSATSVKPGDVVEAMNGKTIEILNTDAEGRLLLADTLCYSKKLRPNIIIDVATLTGGCVVALGESYAGLFCDDVELLSLLQESSRMAGEHFWQLPFASESYRNLLDSSVADLKNSAGSHPSSITAALFLKEFVPEGARWAHLDIAGPAFVNRPGPYIKKGGTGFAVRSLLHFLQQV